MKFAAAALAALAGAIPSLAANITVTVGVDSTGAAGLIFNPQVVNAAVGDFVNFEFRGGNHTVTQSSFANPCTQQFNTVTQANGFDSGFMPYDAASGQIGVFTLEVTQTANPIWFFCARKPHCKGGMYGAINPPATGERTFAAFAASVPNADEPGYGVTAPFTPTTGSGSSSAVSNTQTGTATGTSPSSSSTASTGGASSVSARSGVALVIAGVVGMML